MASRPGVFTTVWYGRAVSTVSPRMPLPTSVPETPHRYSSAASKHGQSRWVQVGLAGPAAGQCRQEEPVAASARVLGPWAGRCEDSVLRVKMASGEPEMAGIGALLKPNKYNILKFVDLHPGGAAKLSGEIHEDDRLVAVNGTLCKDMSAEAVCIFRPLHTFTILKHHTFAVCCQFLFINLLQYVAHVFF